MNSRACFLALSCAVIAIAAVLRSHYFATLVVGSSMQPTLHTGDLLLVDQSAYRDSQPQRGDIVVARYGRDLVVKRVIGLPGDEVEVIQGRVRVDGRPISEDYSLQLGALDLGRGKLGRSRFALLGDNRSLPESQIVHAVVARDQILGKVVRSLSFGHKAPG